MSKFRSIAIVAGVICVSVAAYAQAPGVTKTEILLGSLADLSGPLSGPGKQLRNGALFRMEEINEQGGIHGRKLNIKFEDVAYDPKRAVLAAQKLVNSDRVFAIAASPGTVVSNAAFPIMFPKRVISFMPSSGAREMFEAPNADLKFAFIAPYYVGIKTQLPLLVKEKGLKKVCALIQDDDLGLEVKNGSIDGLKTLGMELAEVTTYKRGATDFSTQIQRLASLNCDAVVLAAIIRETIGAMAAAKRLSYNPIFFGSIASYSELIPKLGGDAVNGLYAVMTTEIPDLESSNKALRSWSQKYQTRFNEEPGLYSAYAYQMIDIFVQAAMKVGPNLTTESFIKAMESIRREPDIFGSPVMTWPHGRHLASTDSRLSKIVNGRWEVVTGYK